MTQSKMTDGPTLSLPATHLVCVLSLQAVLVVTQVQTEVLLLHVVHCDPLLISSLPVPLVIITGHQDTAVCTAGLHSSLHCRGQGLSLSASGRKL